MKNIIFLYIFCFSGFALSAQNAMTEKGDVVILNSDKTWRYANEDKIDRNIISENKNKFIKKPNQNFRVSAVPTSIGVFIDPSEWSFKKDNDKDLSYNRMSFQSKKSPSLFVFLISEEIPIPLKVLGEVAIENAKLEAKDTRLIKREYRNVNGSKILYQELEATIRGIKFKFIGYYISNKTGTVQLVVYSTPDILNANLMQVDNFLNGLVGN